MRHVIVRRNVRAGLGLILLAAIFISVIPWIYNNIFISEEDIVFQDIDSTTWHESLDYSQILPGTTMDLHFLNDDYLYSELKINELDLGGAKVAGDFFVKGQIQKGKIDKEGIFQGKLFSRNLMLNSDPFVKIGMSFSMTKDELEIESLRFGKSYNLKGRISLVKPFETDLRLEIIRADVRGLASMAKVKTPEVTLAIINGVFNIKGNMARLFSDGILESRNGQIGPVGYDFATIRLEGFGPIVNIVDSSIRQGTGTLTMEGHVDLRSIPRGGLFDNLRVRSDMKTIVWDGWDITKEGQDELTMTKDISDKMIVGFKTRTREHLTTYYNRENPEEMNLKYKIGLENLNLKLKDNEEFVGIEHSVKF
ncbi:MAG: hypothetical protein KJ952_07365 [Candidatus Omnitrophica bacterium]|nr:hypothetical protein [Candidatus Omnitrophota bacterium]